MVSVPHPHAFGFCAQVHPPTYANLHLNHLGPQRPYRPSLLHAVRDAFALVSGSLQCLIERWCLGRFPRILM
eukprot:8172406-Pyramimonas_sp.AAC.1